MQIGYSNTLDFAGDKEAVGSLYTTNDNSQALQQPISQIVPTQSNAIILRTGAENTNIPISNVNGLTKQHSGTTFKFKSPELSGISPVIRPIRGQFLKG